MRQRRTLYNNSINSPGRYNNYNVHAPNIRIPKYIKQTLTELKGEIDSNIVTVAYFNTSLTVMDRTKRRSIKKKNRGLNTIE